MAKKLEVNYDRNIYTQLEEALVKVDKLRAEITFMKATHRQETYQLNETHRKTVKEQKAVQEKKLSREIYLADENHKRRMEKITGEIKEENRELKEKIHEQAEEIGRLKAENTALKDIIARNSGNSSKPPSSDGLKKIHNSRKPTGKKVGGQFGHKGYLPKFYDNPTKLIEVKAKKCKCGGRVSYGEEKYTKKQLVDIEIKTNITEYREYAGVCVCCGRAVYNHAPINASIAYGNNLKSLSSMLSIEGNVSINRIGQMLSELSGGLLNLSEGTICKWNKDISKLLAPSIQTIKEKCFRLCCTKTKPVYG